MEQIPPLRVMIVEDEMLLAMQLAAQVGDAGHEVVGVASAVTEALDLAEKRKPDLAFVDIELADGPTGVDLVGRLVQASPTVVVFVTGNAKRIPSDFAGAAGVLAKPYTRVALREAIAFFSRAIGPGAPPPPPPGLTLSPNVRHTADGEIVVARDDATWRPEPS